MKLHSACRTARTLLTTITVLFAGLLLAGCALPAIDLGHLLPSKGEAVQAAALETTPTAEPASTEAENPADASAPAADLNQTEDLTGTTPELSGLVLFTSTSADPLLRSDLGRLSGGSAERLLWALSPDGTRAGRLSLDGFAAGIIPFAIPEGKPLVLANGVEVTGEGAVALPVPEECLGGACSDFQFGLQGRTYAYLSGADACGRTLTLIERANGQVLKRWPGVTWYYFNRDGGMVLSQGSCDSRHVYQYIPNTDVQTAMGPEGSYSWDPSQKAVLIQDQGLSRVSSALWGFNIDTSTAILWTDPSSDTMKDTPIWLADGRHFLYQHRAVHYDKDSGMALLIGPRQVILMDAWTRSQQLLAFDPAYDYHLCETEGEPCEQRYGDWIRLRRTPFTAGGLDLADPAYDVIVSCTLYGVGCQNPAEDYALNWNTGELLPWPEADVTGPVIAPAFPPPDLSGKPVYADPGGSFRLVTSADGRTLWYIPADGDPAAWVADGQDYVYVP